MKRFYKDTAVDAGDGGFRVLLDGKPMRTPAKAVLVVPTEALAEAIAAEWDGVPEKTEINAALLPLTRLAATGLDRVPGQRARVVDDTAKYAASDMLCYRATTPASLVQQQTETWQPLLDWAAERYGARLAVAAGTTFVTQPHAGGGAAHGRRHPSRPRLVGALQPDPHRGSVVIGLAVSERTCRRTRHSSRPSSTSSIRSSAGAPIRSSRRVTTAFAATSMPARGSSRCSAMHD